LASARAAKEAAGYKCHSEKRLVFCRTPGERVEKKQISIGKGKYKLIVEVSVNDEKMAAKIRDNLMNDKSIAEQLKVIGPLSDRPFDDDGLRTTLVELPAFGRWASWHLQERNAAACSDGGVTWAMAVVLAHILGAQPEFPRLRVLELGSGTGLVPLTGAGRGHIVVATDRDQCVLRNLADNAEQAASSGAQGEILTRRLRWQNEEDREAVKALGPFDRIIGADIIYGRAQCDGVRIVLRDLLPGGGEAIFVERDRLSHATSCAKLLRFDGFQVEAVREEQVQDDDIQVKINGVPNPTLVQTGSLAPLVLWVRRSGT